MPLLNRCCCCLSLRTGSIVSAVYTFILYVVFMVGNILVLVIGPNEKNILIVYTDATHGVPIAAIRIVTSAASILSSILLIYGIQKTKWRYLLAYVAVVWTAIIVDTITEIIMLVVMDKWVTSDVGLIVGEIGFFIERVIIIVCILCVFSLYQVYKSEKYSPPPGVIGGRVISAPYPPHGNRYEALPSHTPNHNHR